MTVTLGLQRKGKRTGGRRKGEEWQEKRKEVVTDRLEPQRKRDGRDGGRSRTRGKKRGAEESLVYS